jgi:hypothetical protein
MKRKLLYLSSLFIVAVILFMYACKKENTKAPVDNTPFNANSVEKNAVVATASFDGLNDFAQSGFDISTLKGGTSTIAGCPSVSVNFQVPPFSITLDWGTGCTNSDGITRSGKVTMSLSGLMSEKNNVATMKIENYIVDGMKVSGTTKITFVGLNAGNNWPRYSIISEGKIEFADKSIVTYRSESVRLQAEGTRTESITDDVWRTEIHSASGVNKDGTKWTAKTTKVMIKKGDCKWYNSGTFVITPETGDIKTVDFGDGTCDNKATLKVGDKITEITL